MANILDMLESSLKSMIPKIWVQNYEWILSFKHPNSKFLPLMNPFSVVLIVLGYLLSILILKKIMQNRQKFELKTFTMIHNAVLILLSLYMFVETIRQALLNNFSILGNHLQEGTFELSRVLWIFYFSKVIEFVDTWIMILKKNERQITFLHVYHHTSIFIIWWGVIYYAPGGDGYFSAMQNSFVHVLMYSYYFFSSLGFQSPYKKYLTQLQMFQFLSNIFQASYDYFLANTTIEIICSTVLILYMISLILLFGNYYANEIQRLKKLKLT